MGGIDNRSKNKRGTLCCVPKCNNFGGHKFPNEATATNAWIKWLDEPEKRKLGCRWQFHAVGHIGRLSASRRRSPISEIVPNEPSLPGHTWGQFVYVRMSPISIRMCAIFDYGPTVVSREKGGTDTLTAGMNGYRITSMAAAPPSG